MKPLADIKVLDLTRVVAGPFCSMQLADMGADVIKIEQPGAGDDARAFGPPFVGGESAYFMSVNRGKRSVALDLKHPAVRPVLETLIGAVDVVIENFRPGAADRLGLGYADVAARNPRIVYCSISGFGSTGPERVRPGYDLIIQGESGIMDITGDPDGPPTKIGTSVADLVSALYATQGILVALRVRDATGRGQKVDLAMIDAMASLLTGNAGIYFATGKSPKRRGNAHATIVPYETFEAADGWINVGVANDGLWRRFCKATGRGDLVDDPRFAAAPARVQNRAILTPILEAMIRTQPRQHWVACLEAAGVPVGAIRTVGEVCTAPALLARGAVRELAHPTAGALPMIDTPVHLSDTPGGTDRPPPLLGQHTVEVLTTLGGLSAAAVQRLIDQGAAASVPSAARLAD